MLKKHQSTFNSGKIKPGTLHTIIKFIPFSITDDSR